jgi:methionyl-tRNA formyltransferase
MKPLVLAGNNLAAIHVLDLALEVLPVDRVLIVTPPPTALASWAQSLLAHAQSRGVSCRSPADINAPEVIDELVAHDPGLFLSVYYTQLLAPATLASLSCPVVNFHPALLPLRRGTAPLIWAIVEGDTQTGLTVHHIDAGVDTGAVIAQYAMPIHPNDTGYALHLKMARLVRAAAAELLRSWFRGEQLAEGRPQEGPSSYHSSRDPSVNHLDWSWPRERLRNVVRALAPPLPGAYALMDDVQLKLVELECVPPPSGSRVLQHGMVELRRGQAPLVWASDGPVCIVAFEHEGKIQPGTELPNVRGLRNGQMLS